MDNNFWLPILGYEGRYEISAKGSVKSLRHMLIMKPQYNCNGYALISLMKDKKSAKTFSVHRLVALAFLANPNNFREVNHKDGNKSNNNVENLEWCTRSHNLKHACANNLISNAGFNNANSKLTRKQILEIKRLGNPKTLTHRQIASIINCSRSRVTAILAGKSHADILD